jgi:ubiquinone/menaquinone biosynthesis C-methylase UbiE
LQYRDSTNLHARSDIYQFTTARIPWPRWVFDQLDVPANARILELGCGSGGLWKANLDRLPSGWRVTLTDRSPGMLVAARQAVAPAAVQFTFAQMDAEAIAFASASFDAVIANHMLYHVQDLPRALAEIRWVLRHDGRAALYAATNAEDHMREMKQLVLQFLGDTVPLLRQLLFSLDNAQSLLKPHFSHIEQRSPAPAELRIPHPDPIIRYILSMNQAPHRLAGQPLETLRRLLEDHIRQHGVFTFTTHAGLFIAHP